MYISYQKAVVALPMLHKPLRVAEVLIQELFLFTTFSPLTLSVMF